MLLFDKIVRWFKEMYELMIQMQSTFSSAQYNIFTV